MKIGIFYTTISKNTEGVAMLIASNLSVPKNDVHNLMDVDDIEIMEQYDLLILGSPTYGKGDVHYLWPEIFDEMKSLSFQNKKFAIFCLGDQVYHQDTFAGSLVKMHSFLINQNLNVIGKMSSRGHDYGHCPPEDKTGHFYGLVLDQINQSEFTAERISKWCKLVRDQF